ncbi:COMM domain-containing protein 5-like [Thrips palmi]|uniref:COMM domain-containing protein 5 n=1 Tax=Thrips palmi TaxID=161013 RepID=A0A6P8ZTY2_THRPL|nr:COMM domain-containing protein 5-like [Thrips palmi]
MISVSDDLCVTLIELASEYVKGPSPVLSQEKHCVAVKNASLFGKILPIVEAFVRGPSDNSTISVLSDNLNSLSLSSNSAEKCVTFLKRLKSEIHTDPSAHHLYFPSVSDVKWRVDITISSSTLSRVLEPNIVMELDLSDGQKVTFELSVSKFHKLRYTVASILKEMDAMNNRMSAVKI